MMLAFKIALWVHILAGAVAITVFWLPLVLKKGGALHRRVGWVYVGAAATIAITGFITCARMLTDDNPRNDRTAVFLAYVGVLAAASAQFGVRAVRTKRRTGPSKSLVDLAPPVLLLGGGAALAAFGIREGVTLHVLFALLGIALGSAQLRFWVRAPETRTAWFLEHMSGMGVSCITTVTAFLVVNAHRFGLGPFDLVVWIAPGVVGGLAISVWRRYYEQRFSRTLPI
jgi:uncharacterized membrane protein